MGISLAEFVRGAVHDRLTVAQQSPWMRNRAIRVRVPPLTKLATAQKAEFCFKRPVSVPPARSTSALTFLSFIHELPIRITCQEIRRSEADSRGCSRTCDHEGRADSGMLVNGSAPRVDRSDFGFLIHNSVSGSTSITNAVAGHFCRRSPTRWASSRSASPRRRRAPSPPSRPSTSRADDLTDPAPANTFAHLDSTIVLERSIAELGIYPAVDPLASVSKALAGRHRRRGALRRRPRACSASSSATRTCRTSSRSSASTSSRPRTSRPSTAPARSSASSRSRSRSPRCSPARPASTSPSRRPSAASR